jgi:exosome complex RNA-binding protein Rrp42 (RNase PH superfamily)
MKQEDKSNLIWWIIVAVIVALLMLSACATPKNVTETISKNDSTKSHVQLVRDTVIIRDTVYINSTTVRDSETNEETTLHFGEGGGTFNTQTGEATNVSNVTQSKSKREHELEEEVQRWQKTAEQYKTSLDSARVVNAIFNSNTEEEPVGMSKTERFFHTSGIIAWIMLVIALVAFAIKILRKYKIIP